MITYVVCNTNLRCAIDLRKLVSQYSNIIYNPSTFSGATWTHKRIGGHCTVFSSGKTFAAIGWAVTLEIINVAMVSASFKPEDPIYSDKVIRYYSGSYEPELFPAAMFTKSPITGKITDRGMYSSLSERGRFSVASNYSMGTSMDLTYRDYFGPPSYTPFDESMIELDVIKVRTKSHVKKLNSVKFRYMEWFTRKCKSFLDGMKLTQILALKLLPDNIETMKDFKKIHDMSRRFPRNGTPRDANPAKMDGFYMFWVEMTGLKEDTDELYEALCKYCEGVTRLRQPSVKVEIDRLKAILDQAFSEEFVFTGVKNEIDNLYVYKIAPTDYKYHGIMGYIPYLLTVSLRMLSWLGKIHLEKE